MHSTPRYVVKFLTEPGIFVIRDTMTGKDVERSIQRATLDSMARLMNANS